MITASIVVATMMISSGIGDTLTLPQAERIMQQRNVEVQSARLAAAEAEAAAEGARRWDNPTVTGLYNVYNPVNSRWLDAGREGEVDVAVSQPLPIGRRRRMQQAGAELAARRAEAAWTGYAARMELWRKACEVWADGEREALVGRELECVERILEAYRRNPKSVSSADVYRMEALRLSLVGEQAERRRALAGSRADLTLMLGAEADVAIAWQAGGRPQVRPVADTSSGAEPTAWSNMMAAARAAAEAEVRVQRSMALPQVSLTAEYDKNGNIGHNFWAVGVEVGVPLWNRNRHGVRMAEARRERVEQECRHREQQRLRMLAIGRERVEQCRRMTEEAEGLSVWDIEPAERQYLQHNLSLVEFVDLYTAWREALETVISARMAYYEAVIELNLANGAEQYIIQ